MTQNNMSAKYNILNTTNPILMLLMLTLLALRYFKRFSAPEVVKPDTPRQATNTVQ
jgi:hypothetical protein